MKNFSDPNDVERLDRSLTNQPPADPEVIAHFEEVRAEAKMYVNAVLRRVPTSREKALALTNLEESLMWAIKGIALYQDQITGVKVSS